MEEMFTSVGEMYTTVNNDKSALLCWIQLCSSVLASAIEHYSAEVGRVEQESHGKEVGGVLECWS
jgi:hypothetical protein